jgi:hypothetical protein
VIAADSDSKNLRNIIITSIVNSIEMTIAELQKHNGEHQANDFIDKYANGRESLFAWLLETIEVEPNPKPYSYSTGSWCRALRL